MEFICNFIEKRRSVFTTISFFISIVMIRNEIFAVDLNILKNRCNAQNKISQLAESPNYWVKPSFGGWPLKSG